MSKYDKFTMKALEEILGELKSKKERSFTFHTGRLGAINYACTLEEQMKVFAFNRALSDNEKKEIRTKVEAYNWPDGHYKVKDRFIEYLGNYE